MADVDGTAIEKSDFDHWLAIASKQGGAATQVPQPPEFKACIATKRKTQPKPAKGQPKITDKQLKDQCKTEYEAMRDQVLQLLISYEWIKGEASDQGVKITDKDIQKQFDTTKKQSFPKDADYKKFLKDSGQSEADIKLRVELDLLSNKIREKIVKGKDKVTDPQIAAYYNKNKARFAQPERRDLRVVLTKTEAKANEAKAALDGGDSFKAVAKKFSIDQASKAQGGLLPAVAKGQQEKKFDDAIFKAEKGALTGPIKTQFGYYVFSVSKITKASQQTLAQAKETIKQLLISQNQTKALDEFVKKFQKKWKDRTECRDGFVSKDCSNAPKEKETPSPQPGQVPQQVPQQPAPAPPTEE